MPILVFLTLVAKTLLIFIWFIQKWFFKLHMVKKKLSYKCVKGFCQIIPLSASFRSKAIKQVSGKQFIE